MVRRWLLPTLSEILAKSESTSIEPLAGIDSAPDKNHNHSNDLLLRQGEQQWQSAIYALGYLLQTAPSNDDLAGLLLCAPVPLFNAGEYATAIFSPVHPGQPLLASTTAVAADVAIPPEIPLLPADPLQHERFCLVLTAQFGLVMSLSSNEAPHFQFSFDPADVNLAWQSLRARVMLTATHQLAALDAIVDRLPPVAPDYQLVMRFSQILLQQLPTTTAATVPAAPSPTKVPPETKSTADLELLQALTHEIRTPLTTIRTLTRSLLRRSGLEEQVIKRLESIDRECTEQINRMELIFQAVELAEGPAVDLTSMSVSHLLEQSLPIWQKQAERRQVNLAVAMPQQLPEVRSNPTILDRVLTGLVENFTRNLPAGSQVEVEVVPVGDRIKLQVRSMREELDDTEQHCPDKTQAVGQMLTFRPETGNLSLSLQVTKDLFQMLGGKLVVKPNQQQGETMTIFLPMH
jgi:signal transduction histidine kinase